MKTALTLAKNAQIGFLKFSLGVRYGGFSPASQKIGRKSFLLVMLRKTFINQPTDKISKIWLVTFMARV